MGRRGIVVVKETLKISIINRAEEWDLRERENKMTLVARRRIVTTVQEECCDKLCTSRPRETVSLS